MSLAAAARPALGWAAAPFALVTLASAALLFAVQPMVGKALLPPFGGSAAVWTATMLFFQAALLAGSALLHLTTSRLGAGAATLIHLGLAAAGLATLPLVPEAVSIGLGPAADVLATLALGHGPAMLAMGANAAILQLWYARAIGSPPWWLYAVSNAGSLAGLLAYPLLLEAALDLPDQGRLWNALYLGVTLGLGACAVLAFRRPAAPGAAARTAPPSRGQVIRWVGLALLPASLLLGATQYISTSIMPLPLLWVLPLAAYLVTWIIAFAAPAAAARIGEPLLVLGLALLAAGAGLPGVELAVPAAGVGLHVLVVLAAGLLCHGRLALSRPAPEGLTGFYLCLSLGGVLGGIANAILAPWLLPLPLEYPVALAATAALTGAGRFRWWALAPAAALALLLAARAAGLLEGLGMAPRVMLVMALAAGLTLLAAPMPRPALALVALLAIGFGQLAPAGEGTRITAAGRDFYGAVLVVDGPDRRILFHGRTLHGFQWTDPSRAGETTGYYAAGGGGGRLVAAMPATGAPLRGAVVGLGAGVMACGAPAHLRLEFIEISPAVLAAARRHFHFLSGCGDPPVELADGRMALAHRPPGSLDLIVLDAYGGGAVPVHLLTEEALALYQTRLTPGGLIAIHVSSNHIDLGPVVAAAGARLGLVTLRTDSTSDEQRSLWLAVGAPGPMLDRLREGGAAGIWDPVSPGPRAWTDRRWDLLSILRWRPFG